MGAGAIFFIFKNFMSGALEFCLKHWKPLLIIATVVFLYFYRMHLLTTIEDLQTQLTITQENLELCQDNQVELQRGIDNQNAEIEKWAKMGREQGRRLAVLKGQLTERQKVIDARVHEVLSGDKPKDCESAIKYLIESAPELTWPTIKQKL